MNRQDSNRLTTTSPSETVTKDSGIGPHYQMQFGVMSRIVFLGQERPYLSEEDIVFFKTNQQSR